MMASVFWDKDVILLVDYLEKGATITASLLHISLGRSEAGIGLQIAGEAVTRSVVSPGQCLLTHKCHHTAEVG
jgi:hypothetical protein